MSDGLNKKFIADPAAFVARYPIEVSLGLSGAQNDQSPKVAKPGVHDFDFKFDADKAGKKNGRVILQLFSERGLAKQEGSFTHRIRAFWLPWISAVNLQTSDNDVTGVADMTLDDDTVNYFFTSPLGGCRIQVVKGPPCRVLHVAGDGGLGKKDKGSDWRETQAKQALGKDFKKSRRFSSTQEYSHGGLAFVVGYRQKLTWAFTAQGETDRDFDTKQFSLKPITDTGELTYTF